jgi:putative transposase
MHPSVSKHITYRHADSLPAGAIARMQEEIACMFDGRLNRKTALQAQIDEFLDAGYGSCILKEPEIAHGIVENWRHFDGKRYHHYEWAVMPNHCHVPVEPFGGVPLWKIVLSWKNYAARLINQLRRHTGVRRADGCAEVWRREYWER